MNDLLKKLNTLARAKLSDITPSLPNFERSPNLDRQVSELRERINAALEHEDQLQANAQALRDEIARIDQLADQAVAQGRDAEARHLLEQLKRAEQRLTMAESDLHAHQRAAQELILQVNRLEAAVADNRAEAASTPPAQDTTIPVSVEETDEQVEKTDTAVERISGLIKEAQERTRERISAMDNVLNTKSETQPKPEEPAELPNITPRPKDDLESRIQRLSKRE